MVIEEDQLLIFCSNSQEL